MRILLAAAIIPLAVGVPISADEGPQKKPVFAVYPIATELQRARLARSDEEAPRLRAYVAIRAVSF